MPQDYFFDLETGDPDDIFTLALLATHPRSNLVGVTVHPGGLDQVGLVRHVLERLGKPNIPVGAGTPKSDKPRVSSFYKWLYDGVFDGSVGPRQPDGTAAEVITEALKGRNDVHLVTGAALTNISAAYRVSKGHFFSEWTCQGGFAGDNIVPPELRLPKFAGRLTCPTYNLGGDYRAAEELLCGKFSPVPLRKLVSKNVCHGVFWTPEVQERVPSGAHAGLDLLKEGMSYYFRKNPEGKALHDVIAAAAALNPSIGTWVSVQPYRTPRGEWGCNEVEADFEMGTPAPPMIMIALDQAGFEAVLSV